MPAGDSEAVPRERIVASVTSAGRRPLIHATGDGEMRRDPHDDRLVGARLSSGAGRVGDPGEAEFSTCRTFPAGVFSKWRTRKSRVAEEQSV